MLYTLTSIIQHWLFLPHCCVCGSRSDNTYDLCDYCEKRLPSLDRSCPCCGQKIIGDNNLPICGHCLSNPPAYDRLFALCHYDVPINHLVSGLKFSGKLTYARLFGELLHRKITAEWYHDKKLPDLIIPVPLHKKRLQQRGFNQSIEIAAPIAKQLKIPMSLHHCQRHKATKAQSELTAHQRLVNLQNAFVIKKAITVQHVAIVDDVVTTGHTVNALSKVLKKAGVREIDIWCCGKTQY